MVQKLTELVPRQQYDVKVQAKVKGQILARGNVKAVRKDVTAKCYGGDLSRQMKLLKYQAEGKKRMKMIGRVQLSQDVFRKLLSWQLCLLKWLSIKILWPWQTMFLLSLVAKGMHFKVSHTPRPNRFE